MAFWLKLLQGPRQELQAEMANPHARIVTPLRSVENASNFVKLG
jgi:hypothetical protein